MAERRPYTATDEKIARWHQALNGGSTQTEAANYAGWRRTTVVGWMTRGRRFSEADTPNEDDSWYGQFYVETVKSSTGPLVLAAATIKLALTEAPWPSRIAAAQFLLEKRSPEWARKTATEIEAEGEEHTRDDALETAESLIAELETQSSQSVTRP